MTTNPYGLRKSDLDILERMYLYGRGYGTEVLLRRFFKVSGQYLRKRLQIMKEKKLLKVFSGGKYNYYALSKQVIDLYERNDYLVRMRKRTETIEIIQDKLLMLNFVGEFRTKGFKFINSFDKVAVLKKLYRFSDNDFDEFKVFGGDEIFFNDVMYAPDANLTGEINIALFPREKIYAATYLKDFLIKQYFRLNYKILAQGKKVKFLIVLDNEFRAKKFEAEIARKNIFKPINHKSVDSELRSYYQFSSELKHNLLPEDKQTFDKIGLHDLPVSLTYFDVQAIALPYPHAKLI